MRRPPKPAYPEDYFDFNPPPPGSPRRSYTPMIDLSMDDKRKRYRKYALKAITAYNEYKASKSLKKSENKKTDKSVKESENKKTDKSVKKSGNKKTYKALVTGPSWNYEVIALRREAAEGSGSCNVKWYWDTRADPKPPSECSVLPGSHK